MSNLSLNKILTSKAILIKTIGIINSIVQGCLEFSNILFIILNIKKEIVLLSINVKFKLSVEYWLLRARVAVYTYKYVCKKYYKTENK